MEPSGVNHSPARLRRRLAAIAVFTLIAGCAGPASSTAPTDSPTSTFTGAPSVAPSPVPTPPTGVAATTGPGLFRLVGTAPVIERTVVPDRGSILPGAIAFDDGVYHAWVLAFADTPGTQEMHHLTSPDAVAWSISPDASLEGLSAGLGNPGALPTSVLGGDDGWIMYFVGTLATERQGWEIRRATAPGPDGPWTAGPEPVLRRGPAGAWDSGGLDFPTVLRTDDGFVMLYSGTNPAHPEGGSIGRATSADGIAWTKHDDPVAMPGLCGGFDARAVHQPRVVADGGRLVMAYAGYAGALESRASVGFADSLDAGLTWRCRWPSPALDTGGLPTGFVHTLTAFQRGDRLALLIEWLARNGTDVWLVEAPGDLPGG